MPSIQLRRPGFSRNADRDAVHRSPRRSVRHHRPHRAGEKTSQLRRQNRPRPQSLRLLLLSITQRPSGIAPCAAIVAATRAILNGVTSTGPCPYAANGIAAWMSGTLPAGNIQQLRRVAQRLRAHREHSKLREIRVARNGNRARHGQRSVRRIADVVSNRFAPARNDRAGAAIREPPATEAFVFELRIQAQRRHRRYQLKGRSRRIQPISRAIQQLVGRRFRRPQGLRLAHHRQHVAAVRIHHNHRALVFMRLRQLILQRLVGAHLQANIDGRL